MSSLLTHFEGRAARLSAGATLERAEKDDAVTLRIRPQRTGAAGVVLYLLADQIGTVALDDPACAPAELGADATADQAAIDYFIDVAVEGRATAFHVGRGGCVEVRDGGRQLRTWRNAWPWPGWRRRAEVIDYLPYG